MWHGACEGCASSLPFLYSSYVTARRGVNANIAQNTHHHLVRSAQSIPTANHRRRHRRPPPPAAARHRPPPAIATFLRDPVGLTSVSHRHPPAACLKQPLNPCPTKDDSPTQTTAQSTAATSTQPCPPGMPSNFDGPAVLAQILPREKLEQRSLYKGRPP